MFKREKESTKKEKYYKKKKKESVWYFDISRHSLFSYFLNGKDARMSATFNFANKFFFSRQNCITFFTFCRLAAINSCCLKLLE